MYEDGFEHITNIDISHTVISYMREKCQGRCPNMVCKLQVLLLIIFNVVKIIIFKIF